MNSDPLRLCTYSAKLNFELREKLNFGFIPDNSLQINSFLPPRRGKVRMGVKSVSSRNSTLSLILPLQGGGEKKSSGLFGFIWGCAALMLIASGVQADEIAGKVGYMSGSLVAKRADGSIKIMGPKSEVLPGDMLETSKDSYAQVLLNDGSRMTIRPQSNIKIESFRFNKQSPQEDNAVMRLMKGGFRTVSGLIGKRGNPDAYQLRAATATIGVRGTDFSTRLCSHQDCEDEGGVAAPAEATKPAVAVVKPVAGRVMLVQGDMTAKDSSGKLRKLVIGSPVYEGDLLTTAAQSHAIVAFRDEGRVSLQEGTVFHVERFQYKNSNPEVGENTALRLLKGGVRVVTGLISRVNHDRFQFRVATATIGVRGTGFDTWCNGACASGGPNPGATQAAPLDGTGVYVWSGEVAMTSGTGTQVVGVGQAAILAKDLGVPVSLTHIPTSITQNPTPRPDSVKIDMEKVFENDNKAVPSKPSETPPAVKETPKVTEPTKAAEPGKAIEVAKAPTTPATAETPAPSTNAGETAAPGVYVTVHDGKILLSQDNGKTIDVGKGQTGFTNDKVILQLPATPKFMVSDKQVDAKENSNPTASTKNGNAPSPTGCVVK